MIIIHPDGRVERDVPYVDFTSIEKAVNMPGGDEPFTAVPLPESHRCGYTVYVNDNGIALGLPLNTFAEELCEYEGLLGPAVVVTHVESGEDSLIADIAPQFQAAFVVRLGLVMFLANKHVAKGKAAEN